jgi:NAD(P)-dependent dehydrogenase (short-subunit alcohol dehydrogenase family)
VAQVAQEKLGGVDILVLNHAFQPKPGSWNSTTEYISLVEYAMNVNYFAYVRVASAAMDSLRRSHGRLVVVSSVAGSLQFLPR